MKRSYFLTALVLVLAAAMPACGGGGDKPADSADGQPAAADDSSGDPAKDLQALADGLQSDVDGLMKPVTDADEAIDAVAKLPETFKAAKIKIDAKKFMAEAAKVAQGQDANVDAIGVDAASKAKVTEALDKLKAIVASLKETDTKVAAIGTKIKDAITKVPVLVGKVTVKANLTLKNPLGAKEGKDKATADIEAVKKIGDSFTAKSTEWTKQLTDIPVKAKAAAEKLAKIK